MHYTNDTPNAEKYAISFKSISTLVKEQKNILGGVGVDK